MLSRPSYKYEDLTGEITSEFAEYGSSLDHISHNCNATINYQQNDQLPNDGSQGQAVFTATLTEPLMISPLVFSDLWHRRPGISWLSNLNIQINYDPASLQRIWRQSPNDLVDYTNVQIEIGQPSITLIFFTLPTYMKLPNPISYPYAQIQNFTYSTGETIQPTVLKFQMTSNSIQLQSIPHLMYIGISKLTSTRTRNDTDSFIPITGINLTWTNQSGILSTLTQEDLYLLSVKNGLKQSWAMFSGRPFISHGKFIDTNQLYTKTIYRPSALLCLEFGSDIQLLPEDYPGKNGVWNWQIQVTCQNNRDQPFIPQMDIVFVYHRYMVISGQTVSLNIGFDGTISPEHPKVSYPQSEGFEGYFQGGKFDVGSLLELIPAVGPLLKTGWNFISGLLTPQPQYVPPPPQQMYHPELQLSEAMAYRAKPRRRAISRQIAPPEEDYEEIYEQ
jgi:hypothetical protein